MVFKFLYTSKIVILVIKIDPQKLKVLEPKKMPAFKVSSIYLYIFLQFD